MTVDQTERLLAQAKVAGQGTMPAGTYAAHLAGAKVVHRKGKDGWVLRLIVELVQNGRSEIEWRPLARIGEDPYLLTDGQRRTWGEFTRRLGLAPGEVKAQINELGKRVGEEVSVEIKKTLTGHAVKVSKANGVLFGTPDGALTTSGEIISPEIRTEAAHTAHMLLLEGLGAARLGLSIASKACWQLSRESAWVDLGYDTLAEYLASPEISIGRSEFFRMAAIWEQYILEGGIEPAELQAGEPSKLEVPLRALSEGTVTAREALDDVKTLGRADLREKYGKADKPPAKLDETDAPKVCAHCGHTAEPSSKAIIYMDRTWPIWMTRDMVMAAVASTEKQAA